MISVTPYIKRILIECPVEVKNAFQAPDRDFESVGGRLYLRLLMDRANYTETKFYASGSAGWIRSFGTPTFSIRTYERGIDLKISDQRMHLYDLIKRISRLSTSADLRRKTTIRLIDFVLPEDADREAAINSNPVYEPYTLRLGTLSEPKAGGGSVGLGATGAWIKDGFSVKFVEAGLRYE